MLSQTTDGVGGPHPPGASITPPCDQPSISSPAPPPPPPQRTHRGHRTVQRNEGGGAARHGDLICSREPHSQPPMSVSLPQVHTTELARAAGLTKHGVIGRQCSADVGAGPRPPTPTLTWVHKGAVAHLVLGLERAAQHRAGNAARGERARHPEPQLRDRTTGRPSPGEAPRCCCGRQGCLGITHSQHTHTHRSAPTRPPGRLEPQKHHATRIGAHPLDGLDLVSRDKHLRPAQPSPPRSHKKSSGTAASLAAATHLWEPALDTLAWSGLGVHEAQLPLLHPLPCSRKPARRSRAAAAAAK